ncbi:glyoxalase [Sphingomonas histidinilytica]|nr:glyoxalase [Rhizorhabdus histidinilytica]
MCIVARDLDAWQSFATRIVGALCRRTADGQSLLIRLDELEYRFQILQGDEDDLAVAGWAIDTSQELDDFVASLRAKGIEVHEADDARRDARLVERLFWCTDPDGLCHEFFTGARQAPLSQPFTSPLISGEGFETGRLGVGHYVQNARDVASTVAFYEQVLGLKISDYIRHEDFLPGQNVEATFLYARTGRHHSAAVVAMPTPKRVHHIMVQLKSLDDVGLGLDRCTDGGIAIQHGIGRHPNDQMTSFYMTTPSGFALEYGWGGIVIHEDDWEIKTYSQLSDWGHRMPVPLLP